MSFYNMHVNDVCVIIYILFVVGNTGDGKTTMAISLMVAAYDEDECLLITSPDQLDHVDSRAVSAVLLDDIFGSGSLDEKLLMQWETMFEDESLFLNPVVLAVCIWLIVLICVRTRSVYFKLRLSSRILISNCKIGNFIDYTTLSYNVHS